MYITYTHGLSENVSCFKFKTWDMSVFHDGLVIQRCVQDPDLMKQILCKHHKEIYELCCCCFLQAYSRQTQEQRND